VRALRDVVAGPGPDRWVTPDLDAAFELVRDDALRRAVEAVTGALE
jgi:histidine ammonia-lyase